MGCGLLIEPAPTKQKPYHEIFAEHYPLYMSMGMSYDEYWNGSAELVMYYRKKVRIEQEQKNHEMWWQGYYNFIAVSTAMGNAFREKGKEPIPYIEQPLPITEEEAERQKKEQAEKDRRKAINFFGTWIDANRNGKDK